MAFDTAAQVCFKLAATNALPAEANLRWVVRLFEHPWVYGALLSYGCAFFTWLSMLKRVPIGPAFAASHLQVVSVFVVSALLFREPVTLARCAGALLILAGIAWLAIGADRDPAHAV
jgi:drug/metabolite transporter (DMT)-like permease